MRYANPCGISNNSSAQATRSRNIRRKRGTRGMLYSPNEGGEKSLVGSWIIAKTPTRKHHKNNAACVTIWQAWVIALRNVAMYRIHENGIDKSLDARFPSPATSKVYLDESAVNEYEPHILPRVMKYANRKWIING